MTEFELKFLIAPDRMAHLATELEMAKAPRQRLRARYVDTADGLLGAARLSLRIRQEGRSWVQTLKAPGASAVERLEHNVPRPGRWGADGPPLDLTLHDGTPAGEALRAALGKASGEAAPALSVVYEADIQRRIRVVQLGEAGTPGSAAVELALDRGHLLAQDRSAVVSELEFELKDGEPAALLAFAAQVQQRHGLWLSTVSKAARGERLAKGVVFGEPTRAESPRLRKKMPPAAVLRSTVAACLAQVLGNASEVAAGSREAEHVHQLRVGIRRLRTVLRELGDLAPGLDPAWETTLSASFAELGEFRDRDTVSQWAAAELQAAGAPPIVLPAPAGDPIDPVQTVRAPAFQALLLALLRFTLEAPATPPNEQPGSVKTMATRLARLHKQVERDGSRFDRLGEAEQHRVRKRLKRLRYLAELVGGLFDHDAVDRYLSQLRPAQDALGEHNDTWVALALYRSAAEQGVHPAWFAVGWLTARLPRTVRQSGKALAKVSSATRFW